MKILVLGMRQRLQQQQHAHYYDRLAQCRNCDALYPPISSSGHSSGFCVNCTVDALRRDYRYTFER